MTVAVWNAGVILVFPDCFAGIELMKVSDWTKRLRRESGCSR